MTAPSTTLSGEQIAHEAFAVADVHGLQALSVKRVAGRLHVTPRQMGTYLTSVDDLFDLMLDVALGEMLEELPEPVDGEPNDWHANLSILANSARLSAQRHPWLPKLVGDRPPWGPHGLHYSERTLSTLAGHQLTLAETVDCVDAVLAFAYGYAQIEQTPAPGEAVAEGALQRALYLQARASSGDYPLLNQLFTQTHELDSETSFGAGLRIVLDGIALRIFAANAPAVSDEPTAGAVAEPAASAEPIASAEPAASAEPIASAEPAASAEPIASAEPAAAIPPTPPTPPSAPPVAGGRRRGAVIIGAALIVAAAVIAGAILISNRHPTKPPSAAASTPAVAATTPAATATPAAPAGIADVAAYLKTALPSTASIAADASTATALAHTGLAHVATISADSDTPDFVVSTDQLRSAALPGTPADQLLSSSVPVASFGSGAAAIVVEQPSTQGSAGFQSRRTADTITRKRAEPQLLQNPALHVDTAAQTSLASGALDMRAASLLAVLAGDEPVEVVAVTPSGPEQAAGLPIRVIDIKAGSAALQKRLAGMTGSSLPVISSAGGVTRLTWPLLGEPPAEVR